MEARRELALALAAPPLIGQGLRTKWTRSVCWRSMPRTGARASSRRAAPSRKSGARAAGRRAAAGRSARAAS
eukprot:13003357-Alexandrium_andersonii.AAC.1